MKRVWKPLDIGGLRLYKVVVHNTGKQYVVASQSTATARRLIEKIYKDYIKEIFEPDISAESLKIYMPESWWVDGVPCLRCQERDKKDFGE
jgi:hypothetical protein